MENYNEIKKLAKDIRLSMLKMLLNLGFGHFGGSLSVVETLAVLYGAVMKIDPKNPNWEGRDYMVLSKGHAGPALYAALAIKGYFPKEELMTLNVNGTHLPSHPDRLLTKGVDATTGSLGQGVSLATGIAMAEKLSGKDNRVFTILGDGELNEGQCWEAFQFIAHHNLNNLTVFVDYNKLQLDGTLEEIIDGDGDHLCSDECVKNHRPDCTEDLDKYFNCEAEKQPKPKVSRPKTNNRG